MAIAQCRGAWAAPPCARRQFRHEGQGALQVFDLEVVVVARGRARIRVPHEALQLRLRPARAGEIIPGSTWSFHFWYQNPQGGPAGLDLSDESQVFLCP